MTPDDDEPDEPGDGDEGAAERFADLVGPVRPLRPGSGAPPPPAPRPRGSPLPGPPTPMDPGEEPAGDPYRHPDPAEPRLGAAVGVSDAQLRRLARGEPSPEERIDLHGLRREAAGATLARRLGAARERGLRVVIVVHGRGLHSAAGEAVLRDELPRWLSRPDCARHVGGFAPAPRALGGEGATLVLLRRLRRSGRQGGQSGQQGGESGPQGG